MDEELWHDRWRNNAIPFHKADINHYLEKYFERLALGNGDEVLVHLCGKSVDMGWLARREIDGPPFSVDETEVRTLYESRRRVTRLESVGRLADETKLAKRGLTRLQEHAFLLTGL